MDPSDEIQCYAAGRNNEYIPGDPNKELNIWSPPLWSYKWMKVVTIYLSQNMKSVWFISQCSITRCKLFSITPLCTKRWNTPNNWWQSWDGEVYSKVLPYFGKRKQVTYHLNLSYCSFHISHSVLFFQAKLYA